LSNGNYFTVDYYFHPHQTPKNVKIIFQKLFYAKTNKASNEFHPKTFKSKAFLYFSGILYIICGIIN